MKHVMRKSLLNKVVPGLEELFDSHEEKVIPSSQSKKMSESDDYDMMVLLEGGGLMRCFKYKHQGRVFQIPEPHPVLIYFDSAQRQLKATYECKKVLLENVLLEDLEASSKLHTIYNFYASSSTLIMQLYCALEAFMNYLIPEDYIYIHEVTKKTEHYNKVQIERFVAFSDKYKMIIPEIEGKKFMVDKVKHHDVIFNLKELRDNMVHLKQVDAKSSRSGFHDLFRKALGFNYKQALEAVKEYINYYEDNLIEPCDCGGDF